MPDQHDIKKQTALTSEEKLPVWKKPSLKEIEIIEDTHSFGSSANDFFTAPHN